MTKEKDWSERNMMKRDRHHPKNHIQSGCSDISKATDFFFHPKKNELFFCTPNMYTYRWCPNKRTPKMNRKKKKPLQSRLKILLPKRHIKSRHLTFIVICLFFSQFYIYFLWIHFFPSIIIFNIFCFPFFIFLFDQNMILLWRKEV